LVVGLLKALLPRLKRLGGIYPRGVMAQMHAPIYEKACATSGLEWRSAQVAAPGEVEAALAPLKGEAMFVAPFRDQALPAQIMQGATRLRIATCGSVEHGALLNYGLDYVDQPGRVAAIIDLVLRGANPAEIPFELPDRPSFALNRRTARTLGIEIPRDVLLRVTEFVD
jgi:putative ABC transport system substrate-binding protein